MNNQTNQNENLMNVNIKDILKDYQNQLTELNFQVFVKEEQIKNLQTKLKELQSSKSAKEAKK